METALPNEVNFYQDGFVTVTQARFVTQSKTYAMRNISSVHLFEIVKSKKLAVLLVIIGVLLMIGEETKIAGAGFLIAGGVIYRSIKNEFAVRISTNSGESNSIVSKDRKYVQGIVDALNEAIIHRG